PIEAALLDIAGKSSFDLDADEQGRKYKEELISAGRGFSSNSAKDASLEKVAWQAMDEGRIDAVISGAHVIRDDDKRNRLLHSMTIECLRNCDMLPWAVYGVRNIRNDYPTALDLTRKLNERYAQCRAEGWTPKPTTAADFAPETAAGAAPAAEGQAAQDGSAPAEQKDAQ
ncbi:MAG: hypothetical protein Q4F72_08755, partial [Desulfovibrionaceae bacterium]|nr:hypothetical protein [Desulfovibrionaceae bacterium]